ncbi:MAG: hypothetical protein MUF84_00140 [Anaerolineae bacterium]|jgi:hypothetical protein|nr:hypothetical protein [Anaerolineae bacterium]
MLQTLKVGLIVSLLVVLVGGTVAILARPSEARADQTGRTLTSALGSTVAHGGRQGAGVGIEGGGLDTTGQGRGGWSTTNNGAETYGGGLGNGRGVGSSTQGTADDTSAYAYGQGQGRSAGGVAATEPDQWETIEGSVVVAGSDLTMRTADGDILVGLGQEWYREQEGFVVELGDQIRVKGYYEDGEFKAGAVENLTRHTSITLRDDTGRPMWSGRGNRQNSSRP